MYFAGLLSLVCALEFIFKLPIVAIISNNSITCKRVAGQNSGEDSVRVCEVLSVVTLFLYVRMYNTHTIFLWYILIVLCVHPEAPQFFVLRVCVSVYFQLCHTHIHTQIQIWHDAATSENESMFHTQERFHDWNSSNDGFGRKQQRMQCVWMHAPGECASERLLELSPYYSSGLQKFF